MKTIIEDVDQRQTGRTTKMLKEGLEFAGKVPQVMYIFHNMRMAEHAYDMFMRLLTDIPSRRTKYIIRWKDTDFRFTSINMCTTCHMLEGLHNTMVYCDHVVRGYL